MTDGFRESTRSWREVLLDLKRHGLNQDPKLAIGDGAPQDSGPPCARSSPRRGSKGAGSTRP